MKITIPLPGSWCVRDASSNVLLLNVISDLGIFFSYMLFAVSIYIFIRDRLNYKNKLVYLLAAFVWLCGLTHLATIWTLYVSPAFLSEGLLKAATFAVSLAAAMVAPSSFAQFSEFMHDRNNRMQESALKEAELQKQISELTEAIARRDKGSRERQEHILTHQINASKVLERLAISQGEFLAEAQGALAVAREASERILSRDYGEKRDKE